MQQVAAASKRQRAELFQDTAEEADIDNIIVEKDFWVCWVLHVLYSTGTWRDRLLFKGGTSLSKAFKLIDRFSEDIDLVLKVDGFPEEAMQEDRSGKKQKEFCEELMAASGGCVRKELKPLLEAQAVDVRGHVVEEGDLPSLLVEYERCWEDEDYTSEYIKPSVKLEIGPRGLWQPCAQQTIRPYAAEYFPEKFDTATTDLPVMDAALTFWEKACILHAAAHWQEGKEAKDRYSRHYYDLARIAGSDFKRQALEQLGLLEAVVAFSRSYFPGRKEVFDSAQPGSFKLIPPETVRRTLASDYAIMRDAGMFFREAPKFSDLLRSLRILEDEINCLTDLVTGVIPSAAEISMQRPNQRK